MSDISFHTLHPASGSRHPRRRVGRGGKRGTTSGRGTKGQRARSGGKKGLAYLGMRHIILQTPQRKGHANMPREKFTVVNLEELERHFVSGDTVTPHALLKKGILREITKGVKILGQGSITKVLTVRACAFSASAKEAIEKAGGKAEVVER